MKRIFVCFAMEDVNHKVLFTGQAKNNNVTYDFIDMSVKEPWDTDWKNRCRTRIKGCHGFIVLVSKNLDQAAGAMWEIECAKEEKIPILGVYIDGAGWLDKPTSLFFIDAVEWKWNNIKAFIDKLT